MTPATLHGEDSSLASQCLALCQTLVSQGKAFTFSLKIDSNSTLSFSLDTMESRASAPLPEALTRKKVSPSTKRRNARRRAEFLKKKQSASVQVDVPSSVSASRSTSEQLVTSEKSHSSPAREADRTPPFEFNGGFVYCDKCPDGVLSLDALCLDPYKCISDCGLNHYHRQYHGDDFVWAFRNRDTGGDILHCLGSCPSPPGCPCCRGWRP